MTVTSEQPPLATLEDTVSSLSRLMVERLKDLDEQEKELEEQNKALEREKRAFGVGNYY